MFGVFFFGKFVQLAIRQTFWRGVGQHLENFFSIIHYICYINDFGEVENRCYDFEVKKRGKFHSLKKNIFFFQRTPPEARKRTQWSTYVICVAFQ